MRRRENKILLSLHYIIILIMLMFVSISTFQNSFGMDVIQAQRGVNAKVVSNDKAFVGIIHDEVYKVVYPNDSNYITMHIKNNLPYRVAYELDLSGLPIKDFAPDSFMLSPNEKQLIEIQMLDFDEAVEMLDLNEATKRNYIVQGNISAQSDYGSINVTFQFEVDVELSKPELVGTEILHDETQVELEGDGGEEDMNKIIVNEINSISLKDDEDGKNRNERLTEVEAINVEETYVYNANDEIKEYVLPKVIDSDDNN